MITAPGMNPSWSRKLAGLVPTKSTPSSFCNASYASFGLTRSMPARFESRYLAILLSSAVIFGLAMGDDDEQSVGTRAMEQMHSVT